MSDFIEGELFGVDVAIKFLKLNSKLSSAEIIEKLESIKEQLGLGLSEEIRRTYLINQVSKE